MEINPVNLVRQGSSTTLEAGQTTTGRSYQHVDFSTKIIKGSLNLDPIAAFRLIFVRFEQPRRIGIFRDDFRGLEIKLTLKTMEKSNPLTRTLKKMSLLSGINLEKKQTVRNNEVSVLRGRP